MRKNINNWLLTLCFIIFAQNALAQVQPFTTKAVEDGFFECNMDGFIEDVENINSNSYSDITSVKLEVLAAKGRAAIISINIASWREDIGGLYNKTIIQPDGFKYKKYVTNIILENGENLSINDASLYDYRKEGFYAGTNVGIGPVSFDCWNTGSNKVSMNSFSNLQKQQYICQQLRTYSITKVVIDGVAINFSAFKTKDTFNAMFNTLGEKTGEPENFRFSSSSTTAIKPTASANEIEIVMSPDGDLACMLRGVKMAGIDGKDIKVSLYFENQNTGVWDWNTMTKTINGGNYNVIRIIDKVYNLSNLHNNGGRFKVYAEFSMRGDDGKEYVIGESDTTYITIYKEGKSWRYR